MIYIRDNAREEFRKLKLGTQGLGFDFEGMDYLHGSCVSMIQLQFWLGG